MSTVKECISDVIENMELEEKGMLYCVLRYGKKLQKEAGEIILSPDELRALAKDDVTPEWVSATLNEAFTEGVGLIDALKGIDDDYAGQLDVVINKVLFKALKVPKPRFSKSVGTIDGAMQREEWIVEKLIDTIITNMDEDKRVELARQVEEMLKEKGIDIETAAKASTAILVGGLTAARAIMGFQFHMLVAIVVNSIIPSLGLVANAALQRLAAMLFGPIGWIITVVTMLPLLTALINPRRYDKYIPAVFVIGVARMSQKM